MLVLHEENVGLKFCSQWGKCEIYGHDKCTTVSLYYSGTMIDLREDILYRNLTYDLDKKSFTVKDG